MSSIEVNHNISENESIENGKMSNHVSVFERSLLKSKVWVTEMHAELNWLSNDNIYHLLRAVFHTLRDQLSIDEAAHFSAQLPLILRGTFYECWNPKKNQAKGLKKEEFLEAVKNNLNQNGWLNFELETGVAVVLKVIMNHVSPGEINDIIQSSKPSLKIFFEDIRDSN